MSDTATPDRSTDPEGPRDSDASTGDDGFDAPRADPTGSTAGDGAGSTTGDWDGVESSTGDWDGSGGVDPQSDIPPNERLADSQGDAAADPTDGAGTEAVGGKRRGLRPLHFHIGFWTLMLIFLAAAFLVLTSMSLTGRVVVLPDWVGDRVVSRLDAAMEDGSVSLRRVEFGVTPKGRPKLRLVDVGIRDGSGLELARLNAIEGGFRLGPALLGRIEPSFVALRGAQVTLRRLSDGSFDLSLGQQGSASGSLANVLDAIDMLFTDGLMADAEAVEASELTITLEDARSGRIWQVTDGRMQVKPSAAYLDTNVSFDVFNQTEAIAHTDFSFRTARASSEASLSVRFDNVAAPDIAAQTPALAFLSVIDAPISGALRASIATDGALSELAGALSIAEGALSPVPGAPPAAFDGAKVYIDYDPGRQRLDMLGLSVASEVGAAQGDGHFYLTDFRGGWPGGLMGQVNLNAVRLNPADMFQAPLDIDSGKVDFRLRLDPFTFELGQAVLYRGERRFDVTGEISAGETGWGLALDSRVSAADRGEILNLWPVNQAETGRQWFADHVTQATALDSRITFRRAPGETLHMSGVYNLRDAVVQPIDTLPPLSIAEGYVTQTPTTLTVSVDKGSITAPDGSVLDISGMTYHAPDLSQQHQVDIFDLRLAGPLEGALSILDGEPFSVFKGTGLGPDVARGHAEIAGRIAFPSSGGPVTIDTVDFDLTGVLTEVRSDRLLEDKLVLADRLELHASNAAIELTGPARVGQATLSGTWRQPIATAASEAATLTGVAEISDRSLGEFGIDLPEDMITGAARGGFTLTFPKAGPNRLSLRSDLTGAALDIEGTGWRKPAASKGNLEVEVSLGTRPVVERISLSAPGLSATGRITTAEGGGLGEARFDRVKLGGWLDGPVVLTGRGAAPIGIAVTGGTVDLRKADFGSGSGGTARGPKQPLTLKLDKLIITDGITLNRVRADLDMTGGLQGSFKGRVDGSGAPIEGTMAQTREGAAFRVTSTRAGGVLRGAGVFDNAAGGKLTLVLAPVKGAGTYEGDFTITGTSINETPSLLKLLSAVSIVGIVDQARGGGIGFSEIEGRFRLEPGKVTLYRSSAVGVSLGLSMDGYYDMKGGTIDMQGVLSPFYIVNALGRLLSPREGEGLIGFNFNIKGNYANPEVTVNPLSILTPGAFREIFRRPPPEMPAK